MGVIDGEYRDKIVCCRGINKQKHQQQRSSENKRAWNKRRFMNIKKATTNRQTQRAVCCAT